jgi:hypothetical protein
MDQVFRSERHASRIWLAITFLPTFSYVIAESLLTHQRAAFGWMRCDARQAWENFTRLWSRDV